MLIAFQLDFSVYFPGPLLFKNSFVKEKKLPK